VKKENDLEVDVETLRGSYDLEAEIEKYEEIGLIDGVYDVLRTCRAIGLKTALATSASKKRMTVVLDIFHLHELFDVTVCDDDVTKSKPDPEIFLKAADTLRVKPEDCVVFEDSQNGILAAKSANMATVGYDGSPYSPEELEPDRLISDFTKLDVRALLIDLSKSNGKEGF